MIPLDAPVWGQLSSAGGDVRALLPKLVRGEDFRANLALLSEDLSHQLSFYNATAYVLPYLADLCTKLPLEDKLYLIAYTGPAVAAEGVASLPPDNEPYREFQEGLISLRRQAAALVAAGAALELLRASGLELRPDRLQNISYYKCKSLPGRHPPRTPPAPAPHGALRIRQTAGRPAGVLQSFSCHSPSFPVSSMFTRRVKYPRPDIKSR